MSPRERVLVRLPSWLGDFVACEPAVRALIARFGERTTLVAPRRFLPLLGASPARAVAIEDGEPGPEWAGHDVAVLFTGSFRSAFAAWRARIPRRVGWARDGRYLLLSDSLAPAREAGEVPWELGVAGRFPRWLPRPVSTGASELVALLGVFVRDSRPRIDVPPEVRERMRTRLAALGLEPGRRFVLANVGARAGSAKGYPPAHFARALARLAEVHGIVPVLACGPGEEALVAEAARSLAPTFCLTPVHPPPELLEFAALAELAAVVLTADNGLRHVAQAVGARLVVVAGPTDPRHTAAHQERTRLVRIHVTCGPCHQELCAFEGVARGRCMHEIEPERLALAASEWLA
ncbi:MAG: hypothetical protein HZA52_15450 [Planctomycetes bacterium]|nr:hypothetical protein [Planctomycetota bacterium]